VGSEYRKTMKMRAPRKAVGFMSQHRWARRNMSAYVDDDVSRRQRQRLDEHTSRCAECRRMLRTMVAVVRGLRDLPAPPSSNVGEAVVRRLRKEESDRPPKTARGRR